MRESENISISGTFARRRGGGGGEGRAHRRRLLRHGWWVSFLCTRHGRQELYSVAALAHGRGERGAEFLFVR